LCKDTLFRWNLKKMIDLHIFVLHKILKFQKGCHLLVRTGKKTSRCSDSCRNGTNCVLQRWDGRRDGLQGESGFIDTEYLIYDSAVFLVKDFSFQFKCRR
jgi:hypothetical protein